MRALRLKIDPRIAASTNHLMTRTNNREEFFGEAEKRAIRTLIQRAAEFCGLAVWTFALMPNHPHIFVFNPPWSPPGDEELLRRFRVLNPHPKGVRYRGIRLEVIEAHLKANSEFGVEWRRKQIAQMGDISHFMKIVKQRLTVWFNHRHRRTGSPWGGRFKNTLVEQNSNALLSMATYIDLNPVRAKLVNDPKDYRYCGYAEAVAGNLRARDGIMHVTGLKTWDQASAEYRKLLYAIAVKPRKKGRWLPIEDFEKIVKQDGKIPLADALRCRIRRFSDSVVFGTTEFVAKHLVGYDLVNHRKRRGKPCPMPHVSGCEHLATLRRLRRE
jgi:REP element-mobilizing transposase RayT